MENDIFWSVTGSGFKEPGGTLNSQYPVVTCQEAGINGNWKEAKKGKCVPVETTKQSVRIFVYSSTREQSNKRSGAGLKRESKTSRASEPCVLCACETLKIC